MSVINDVLEAVRGLCNAENPYATVLIGALPADNGISLFVGSGAPLETYMNKGISIELSCVLNAKHHNAKVASDTLNDLHQALTQATDYTETNTFQITDISTISVPSYIGREENKQYLYGSSLRVRFYMKKVVNNA